MLYRRGGDKPEIGQLKELKCSGAALAGIVERQALKGWHIADGRHGTDDLRDKFRKSHVTDATEQGGTGGNKTVTPSGNLSVDNKTATGSITVNNTTAGGSVSTNNTTAGGTVTVNNHTLSESQMPAHDHEGGTAVSGAYANKFGSVAETSITAYTFSNQTSNKVRHLTSAKGSGSSHNHGGSFSGDAHNHTASFSGNAHNHGGSVAINAHNHSGSFSGNSQDNQPQHIVVLLLQYTAQKIAGVTP